MEQYFLASCLSFSISIAQELCRSNRNRISGASQTYFTVHYTIYMHLTICVLDHLCIIMLNNNFSEGTRFCVQQMATNNDIVCRRSLRTMSFHQAVTSLYRRSNGLVILVAIKEHDIVHINPSARKSCHRCIGDFEAIFLISPSWEVAWEIVSEEDNQCLISKIPLNNHWNNNEADIPDRHVRRKSAIQNKLLNTHND